MLFLLLRLFTLQNYYFFTKIGLILKKSFNFLPFHRQLPILKIRELWLRLR